MSLTTKIGIGTPLQYDGERWVVQGFTGGSIQLCAQNGRVAIFDLAAVTASEAFKVLDVEAASNDNALVTYLDNVPEHAIKEAEKLLGHLNEVETGYQSGNKASALPGEPRFEYDPDGTTVNQRVAAKTKETGISDRTLWRLKTAFRTYGIYGLVDQRYVKTGKSLIDPRVEQALRQVLAQMRDKSNVTQKRIMVMTEMRLHEQHPTEKVPFPSKATFYRLIERITKGAAAFGSAKARRSIANRPQETYRQQEVTRPGEFVLIDSTPFDAFALDPVSFNWIQLQLTIALDLYTRSLVGWRFTPVSTKGVDAALLLYDIIRPKLMQEGWPQSVRWPYIGVPESIAIELADEDPEHGIAGVPVLHPETVVVDHGKVFISQAFKDACTRMGINVQLARPYTPTDKSHVERVFRSIRENFVERLPGYKGPDVFSRGLNVEEDAFYFLDEIEAKFSFWVVTDYQRDRHNGLTLPGRPLIEVSPNDMYNEGIVRAGFVHVVASDLLYYELLPTEWRTIQHYGVELRGLRYDGDILSDYRNRTSPFGGVHAGKWPIRYDPRDLSCVFFFDEYSGRWHTLRWRHDSGEQRPFNEASVSFAKSLLISRGGNSRNVDELAESLNSLLDRMVTPTDRNRRERRLAAVNAMHAQQAKHDLPVKPHQSPLKYPEEEPDAEVDLFVDGPIQGARTTVSDERPQNGGDVEVVPLRTIEEAMEDDDDELGF